MSIIAANVKLYKAQEQNDNDNGGGVMTGTELADGVSGNLFPSISRLDKTGGKLNLRKLFGKIDSDNSDLYGGAHAVLTSLSTDAEVSELIIRSEEFERSDLVDDLEGRWVKGTYKCYIIAPVAGATTIERTNLASGSAPSAGVFYWLADSASAEIVLGTDYTGNILTLRAPLQNTYTGTTQLFITTNTGSNGRCHGIVGLASAAASGQKDAVLDGLTVRLLPTNKASAPGVNYNAVAEEQTVFAGGDTVLLIEGATEEECTISSISGNTLTMVSNLTNSFTAAAVCCSVCPRGDWQAAKGVDFTQETWDGSTFSDTQSGAPASGTYNFASYPLSVNNHDAITDRIGLDFTSSTAFNIISEKYGNLGTGSTSVNVAPINPITGDPYFTLNHNGFGGTWQSGNVLRFNVIGAMAEIWLARCINTGASGTGSDSTDLELRGDVAS